MIFQLDLFERRRLSVRCNVDYLPQQTNTMTRSCTYCGKSPVHACKYCAARNATCRLCSKLGHFQTVCQSLTQRVRDIHTTNTDPQDCAYLPSNCDDENEFLGVVIFETPQQNPWAVTIQLNSVPIEFHIDTGTEVTVITEALYHKVGSPSLTVSDQTLKDANNQSLCVKGMFVGHSTTVILTLINTAVIRDLAKPLLGRPAIEKLNSLARVQAIQKSASPTEQFPQLFTGLGKLPGLYTIKLSEGAKPFSLHVPRQVAVPLMEAVKQELNRMEQLGVIAPVQEPTPWCSSMVVVLKLNGQV